MKSVLVCGVLLAAVLLPGGSAQDDVTTSTAHCGPPCGPIPVIITILMDKTKGVRFDESGMFEREGVVEYYVDIYQNGWIYDPTKQVEVQMKINKQPPWTKTSVEPSKFRVLLSPAECPTCYTPRDPSLEGLQYVYRHPTKITVEKLRDPTPEELKRWLKSDGTYRVSVSAVSNDSMVGTNQTGTPAGLMEGYGVKEIRFLPDEAPEGAAGAQEAKGAAPGAPLVGLLAAVAAAGVALRRRR